MATEHSSELPLPSDLTVRKQPGATVGSTRGQGSMNSLTAAQATAAGVIQRTYRGHRTRRELKGFGLDPSTRWIEAIKDAQYQNITTPSPPRQPSDGEDTTIISALRAQKEWRRIGQIARRAGADDHSPSLSSSEFESADEISSPGNSARQKQFTPEERKRAREKRAAARAASKQNAKMMGLEYFLEMVDLKHRYGSNLRKYHACWKSQTTTNQNFFYWLDHGEGKEVELPECSRARLQKEQVRYLSREERQQYLVRVDRESGLLYWAKNGEEVWTKDELYKDSLKGIVSRHDTTPDFRYNVPPPKDGDKKDEEDSTTTTSESEDEEQEDGNGKNDEGERYVNEEFHQARGLKKLEHFSPGVIFNHMIRDSIKKGHKWIFIADTSFRLYIGIKQSGAFQHSSFLHGSRIAAAGLIKVKRGQLRSLSPLSGHYRPPAANFREFVHNLRDAGVDMSRVSISKSYAVLVGIEGYGHAMRKKKEVEDAIAHEKDKLLHPARLKAQEEERMDKSESAQKERKYLENFRQQQQEHQQRRSNSNRNDVNSSVSGSSKAIRRGSSSRRHHIFRRILARITGGGEK